MSNITTYLISASLILRVIRQIREPPLDARSLAVPVLAVGAATVMLLHSAGSGRNCQRSASWGSGEQDPDVGVADWAASLRQ